MAKLTWDGIGEKEFEVGVSQGVLFMLNETKSKSEDAAVKAKAWEGKAWNGLTNVTESPEGGDPEEFYADNTLYAVLRGNETFGGSIEAFTYPPEFEACIGHETLGDGVYIGQQNRKAFGLAYRSEIGNDTNPNSGYKLHLVYNCTANASEMSHDTVEDSPSLEPLSFDFNSTPTPVTGHKPTSSVTIDSRKVDSAVLKKIEDAIYGTADTDSYLPLPAELITMLTPTTP